MAPKSKAEKDKDRIEFTEWFHIRQIYHQSFHIRQNLINQTINQSINQSIYQTINLT